MSRTKARKQFTGRQLQRSPGERGIYVCSVSLAGLAEEAGPAYKDIDAVVDATERTGLSRCIVRFAPLGNVKAERGAVAARGVRRHRRRHVRGVGDGSRRAVRVSRRRNRRGDGPSARRRSSR